MPINKQEFTSKIHLIISVCIVLPVALVYGFKPALLFNIHINTTDAHHFFKAVMGLYIGFSVLWLLGIFNKTYLKMALVSNCIFMFGIGFGRLLGYILEGTPTVIYQIGLVGELLLACYGFWVLQRHTVKKEISNNKKS
ncbi:DUF4345 domain-containing protein [Bizionia sediminis]|uniref:DUF4345 domain-containing protein n=1 Tax=Bizionia sediminis TaxID=1737064 RepID=A0ABW5KUU1_9FLAO